MANSNLNNPYGSYQDARGTGQIHFGDDALRVPDPSKYLFGTSSPRYQAELNNYQHNIKEAEWNAQLALMDDEREYQEYIYNKYNSPSAQVSQMHKAGLNPDLQNISSSGISSSPASTPTGGVPSLASGSGSFGSLSLDILTSLPQLVSMVTNITSAFNDNASQKLSLGKQYEQFALNDLLDMYSVEDIINGKINTSKDFGDSPTAFDRRLFDFESEKVSKRSVRRYMREFDNLLNGNQERLKSAIYNRASTGANERSNFIKLFSQYGFSMPDNDFAKLIRDINELDYKAGKASSQYDYENFTSKAGTSFKSKGMDHINKKEYFIGILEYLLGMLLDGQFHFKMQNTKQTNR